MKKKITAMEKRTNQCAFGNHRTDLQLIHPELKELGIEWFGFYSKKTPDGGLKKHDHENCFEICYLEQGMQPYLIYRKSMNPTVIFIDYTAAKSLSHIRANSILPASSNSFEEGSSGYSLICPVPPSSVTFIKNPRY